MIERMETVSKYILCVIYVIFSVSGLTFIKIGSRQETYNHIIVPLFDISVSIWSLVGIICYGISFFLYLALISKFDLGIIIPLLGGIINILILVIAYTILKERITLNMVIGAIIIITGIFVMNVHN